LARKARLTRAAVYRVILDERVERLTARKVRFIDDPLYHQEDAAEVIRQIVSQEEVASAPTPEETRVPRDLPAYLQDLWRTPLLSAARERALFLKLNFHKYQFVTARRELEPQFAGSRDLDALEQCLRDATETKNAILRANLRLVVSVARRHLRPGLPLMELISDGNLTLMRAVEGFDIHRGCRFSTYATLSLMKGFARSVPQMIEGRQARSIGAEALALVPDRRVRLAGAELADREQVDLLLSRLSGRERKILAAHYGLDSDAALTHEQLARRMGLSKQRVRQIEQSALEKLRRTAR
jgi:RNA polymerase sigma factor (sigma-70 family)